MAMYISVGCQGCLHEGAARRDDQGREQGLTFVQTLSPSQDSIKTELFLVLFPRPGE